MPRCASLNRERSQGGYHTDAFRIWDFKVKQCSKTGPHDWTQCPFAHTGEKAKRRDPQTYNYCGDPCSEFVKTGKCQRGDACPQAHGTFEVWLHPSRYRTKWCKEGADCTRRICFFAHTEGELRQLDNPYFPAGLPADELFRAYPTPFEVTHQRGLQEHNGQFPFQANLDALDPARAVQLQQAASASASAAAPGELVAAQLQWLAACIASMPQAASDAALQPPGRAMPPGALDTHAHDRVQPTLSTPDDDPIRADLSHGILSSGGFMDPGQQLHDPLGKVHLEPSIPLNQKLRFGIDANMGMGSMPGLDLMEPPTGLNPSIPMDAHAPFMTHHQAMLGQNLIGNPGWTANTLTAGNPFLNRPAFDMAMWD